MKSLRFHKDVHKYIAKLGKKDQVKIFTQLDAISHGLMPSDYKIMKGNQEGIIEIRVTAHRVFYVCVTDVIHVIYAFRKQSNHTPKQVKELISKRRDAVSERR